jgi:hypothetical protein
MIRVLFCIFVSFLCCQGSAEAKGPSVLYLTWMHDPTSTMTIQWHTVSSDPHSEVFYRKTNGETEWKSKEGTYAPLPKTDLYIHTVELDELASGEEYTFRLKGKKEVYRFRTLSSNLSQPLRFVVGGDAYFYFSVLSRMNERIAACNPDFVVVGGDIAYTNGRRAIFKGKGWELNRWRTFLKQWKRQMVTSDGRLIPILPVLGNHDVKGSMLSLNQQHHFLFYELFALAEKGVPYRVVDIGKDLSLFLLDSGHSFHVNGMQSKWLEEVLSQRENMRYKMAAYHIAGFPSVYPYQSASARLIRKNWSPLFERYHLNIAFEHHNHAYKRTFPIRKGKINPNGVVYMGDGSWGVSPRKPKKLWYLANAAQANAVCLVTLTQEQALVEAINIEGKVIDSMAIFPNNPIVAWDEGRLLKN